jgi:hypothetical protein
MKKVITDVWVWDQLPEGYDKFLLAYDLDDSWSEIYNLTPSGLPERFIPGESKMIFVPMFSLEEPMSKSSYRNIPKRVKEILETFLVSSLIDKASLEAPNLGKACRVALDVHQKSELTTSMMIYSGKKLPDTEFMASVYNTSLWSLPINGLEENELLFVPVADFVGALAVSYDHSEIGAFLITKDIVKVKIV